jgi:integrase
LWRNCIAERLVKPSTLYSYQSILDRFILPELGERRIDQIQKDEISRLLAGAHERRFSDEKKGLSNKYRLNLYALLKSIFEVAVEYDFAVKNPVRKRLHRPKCEKRKKVALTATQIARVVQLVPKEHRVLFLCLALTGLRIGEVLALRWQDVDGQAAKLTVTHNLWRGRLVSPKTDASAASVPLAKILIDALAEHRKSSNWTEPDDFVFCKLDGSTYETIFERTCSIMRLRQPALREYRACMVFTCSGTPVRASLKLRLGA